MSFPGDVFLKVVFLCGQEQKLLQVGLSLKGETDHRIFCKLLCWYLSMSIIHQAFQIEDL